jgi:hypothetical protein
MNQLCRKLRQATAARLCPAVFNADVLALCIASRSQPARPSVPEGDALDPKRTRRLLSEPRTSHFQRRAKLITMRFTEHR